MQPDHFEETVFADLPEGLRVVVLSGRHAGAALEVNLPMPEPLSIGSHFGCSLVLPDEALSSVHALLFERDAVLWVSRVPGCGPIVVDERPLGEAPVRLVRGMRLDLAGVGFRVEGDALAEALPAPVAKRTRVSGAPRKRLAAMPRMFASALCILCGGMLLALSIGGSAPARSKSLVSGVVTEGAAPRTPASRKLAEDSLAHAVLDDTARQVERYIGDPGVQAVARYPGQIELKGTARSGASLQQIEKIGKALPSGVVLSSAVSYPKDEKTRTPAAQSAPLSKLAKKVLQVAASERVPFIEIEGGERVFEGGQLNGYELLKIAPGEIVARRDGLIQSFKVE